MSNTCTQLVNIRTFVGHFSLLQMRNLTKIHRIRLSPIELEILKICKENKIKSAEFIREAIREKAIKELGFKTEVPF